MTCDEQLIYDVGLHKGEDTDFYLKKGYRVVAFEANPGLIEFCRSRFEKEIRAGQLHIVEGAIAPQTSTGKVTFYLNKNASVWGTIDNAWVERNAAWGTDSEEIVVDRINMVEIFKKFGIPYFLKIDIEGADGLVLEALQAFEVRPQFISIEANTVDISALMHDLETLNKLGYKQFQLAPQKDIQGRLVDTRTLEGQSFEHIFPDGASGLFGNDLPGVWIAHEAIVSSFTPPFDGWQDIHASLSAPLLTNIALNRPATQSSTSAWSTNQNPEVDARVANNGDTISQTYFHTAVEAGPWWQVDLGELFFVEKIVFYNRNDMRERLKRFTIFGSEDGRAWFPIHKKDDESIFSVFAADLIESAPLRYVKVRLDGYGYLHFRECQIFGRHVKADQ